MGHEISFTGCKYYDIIDSLEYSNSTRILESKYWYHPLNAVHLLTIVRNMYFIHCILPANTTQFGSQCMSMHIWYFVI